MPVLAFRGILDFMLPYLFSLFLVFLIKNNASSSSFNVLIRVKTLFNVPFLLLYQWQFRKISNVILGIILFLLIVFLAFSNIPILSDESWKQFHLMSASNSTCTVTDYWRVCIIKLLRLHFFLSFIWSAQSPNNLKRCILFRVFFSYIMIIRWCNKINSIDFLYDV